MCAVCFDVYYFFSSIDVKFCVLKNRTEEKSGGVHTSVVEVLSTETTTN